MSTDFNQHGAGPNPAPSQPSPVPSSPSAWQTAVVERVTVETYRARTFALRLAEPRPFLAGQHYDVRLTAPDGYQAQRSYSIASAPSNPGGVVDLTVELISDGEVSPYFHEVVQPGDELEVRGPIGGPFTWTTAMGGPLFLIAGGSGIVPLRSILAHREAVAPALPTLLLYSARTLEDVIYRDWLDALPERASVSRAIYTLTRRQPDGWSGYQRRVDPAMLVECLSSLAKLAGDQPTEQSPLCYVCGPTGFVEHAADALLAVGIPEPAIKTERFGPTS